MRVLVLVSDRPAPPITGSRVRNFHLWPAMRSLGVDVRLLGLDQEPSSVDPRDGEFFRPNRGPPWTRAVRRLLYTYHQGPRSEPLARRALEVFDSWGPDVVHCEELRMARYWPSRARVKTVALHNVESDLEKRLGNGPFRWSGAPGKAIHLATLRRYENAVVHGATVAFAFSEHDRRRYAELYPGACWCSTRNGAAARSVQPHPEPQSPRLLFVGSLSYAPNVEGLFWYLDEVHARLSLPLTVAGSRPTAAVRERIARAPDVTLLDTPDDLGPVYAQHSIALVPLLDGSGTRGKILEALAHGRAVVSTTIGSEGLELGEGEGIVRANGPEKFASAIRALWESPDERRSIAGRGRAAVLERYDWSVVARHMREVWESCLEKANPL